MLAKIRNVSAFDDNFASQVLSVDNKLGILDTCSDFNDKNYVKEAQHSSGKHYFKICMHKARKNRDFMGFL